MKRTENSHHVIRLIPPRPTFDMDMDDRERDIMGRHAAYWGARMAEGDIVVYGPVRDGSGAYGLGVIESSDAEAVKAFVAADPAVAEGLMRPEVGPMLVTIARD